MLIDATHPEETRVVVLNGNKLEEFDFETSTKKQIKGNIYLAKVTRVEPSLQAAFVEYGGNRHGFLAFSEIHPDYYRIPVADREALYAAEREDDAHHDEGRVYEESAAFEDSAREEEPEDEAASGRSAEGEAAESSAARTEAEGLAPEAVYAPYEPEAGEVEDAEAPEPAESEPELPGIETVEPGAHEAGPEGTAGEAAAAELADEGEARGGEPANGEAGNGEPGHGGPSELVEAPVALETVGGDDIEEAQARPRVRHYRNYKIQEVIKRRQILLVQVTKEERGTKGAALTTYMSLAGRYCVLMPNAGRGGGVSRKITSAADRRRLKELMEELDVPEGMGVIVRTAGSERSKVEIKRDFDYLLRLWDDIRELTLRSSAPAMIYEEGNLIKRAIRDLYTRDIDEILVEGEEGYRIAKEFMRMLMPSHASRVRPYRDPSVPLFHRFQVDSQIDQIHNPVVQLKSGGYIVINPTEALVSIDVNSGRATRERNIEETATKTNLEAADEIARQLRLRDLAGLVVIDFIDMEEGRNQRAVENRLKEAMKFDRARIQLGRISPFGLLELSRQRLRSSLIEASTQTCPHCNGTGTIRSTESTTLVVLRAIEEEGIRRRTAEIAVFVPTHVALYLLNQKRDALTGIEKRYGFRVMVGQDDSLIPPAYRLERVRGLTPEELAALPAPAAPEPVEEEEEFEEEFEEAALGAEAQEEQAQGSEEDRPRRRRRRRKRRRGGEGAPHEAGEAAEGEIEGEDEAEGEEEEEVAAKAPAAATPAPHPEGEEPRRRRRGRRGGRRHRREEGELPPAAEVPEEAREEYYRSPLDFARDGRPEQFDEEQGALPASAASAELEPVTEAAAAEAAAVPVVEGAPAVGEAAAVGEAPAAEAAPKRRRTSRKKAEAVEGAEAAPAAEAAKPKRSRAKKPAAEKVEPVPAEPLPGEPVPAPEPEASSPVAESLPHAEIPVAEAEPAAPPAEPEPTSEPDDNRPRRTGWWRRLIPAG
jgi:ribonuclease E